MGTNAIFVKQDVSNENDWQTVVQTALENFNQIDILVNNAGITYAKSLFDVSADDYLKIFKINQLSVFLGMKFVAAEMKKSGAWKHRQRIIHQRVSWRSYRLYRY
ncbi:SDR family NAD(P)-dependent oxidoreductase [Secundilactobacillus collinoides]|uniref:SDR family NAD(P)-dependent oxidoreductase n=1 Tax=Secundilactobacillus collinoides TaxID=33960 RepID=UPI000B2E9EC3|nr:SDR family NAD(P)-dependent oxidoreductase [Secundilactobacillus collinoides]